MPHNALISLEYVSFRYRDSSYNNGWLYDDFDFKLRMGSVTAVMGSSGSGKSTLGLLLSGMIQPSEGHILRNAVLKRPGDVVYLDQHALNSVFPWQNVRKNVEYPLLRLGWPLSKARGRAATLLHDFGIEHLANALPKQLSGGELQRLALCRCLSWSPRLTVLDESLSALDHQTKTKVISALHATVNREDVNIVLITHSVADAMAIATRCVVLGDRPVKVVCDVEMDSEYPRDETSPRFRAAQEAIIGTVRNGIL